MTIQPEMKYPYRSVDWAIFKFMDILDADKPTHVYLRRFIALKTPWVGLYVHWIYTKDEDRDPHNHPFNFWSWVVRGGYEERRYWLHGEGLLKARGSTTRIRKRWSLARTTRTYFHRIVALHDTPTITVILTGRRSKWGFLTKDGYVPQEEYVREKEVRWAKQLAERGETLMRAEGRSGDG
jgi:hypothetical protein